MSQVIVFPRGQLTPADRSSMAEAGIVAVEADDPSAVVLTVAGVPLASSDDLAIAALIAVDSSASYGIQARFVAELRKRIDRKAVKS